MVHEEGSMNLDFVNEKILNGHIYRAWRSSDQPKLTFITKDDGQPKAANLKQHWNDSALEALF